MCNNINKDHKDDEHNDDLMKFVYFYIYIILCAFITTPST